MKSPSKKTTTSKQAKVSKPLKAKGAGITARNKERELRVREFTIRLTERQQTSFQEAVIQFASMKFPNKDVQEILLPFTVDPKLDDIKLTSSKLKEAKELLKKIGIPWSLIDGLRTNQ
jgi:hypothetical protein